MVQLLSGNVLLKPAQKRRILSHLRRTTRLGNQVGDFSLTLSLRRRGRSVTASAVVHDRKGRLDVQTRQQRWQDAVELLINKLHAKVHDQRHGLVA